jgi:membrane associated rhomboid family serine protease
MRVYTLYRHLAGFKSVGLAFIIFSLVNLAIFGLVSLHPPLLEGLWLSADRPWGILTSAFTHADLPHLTSNLESFTLAALLFIPVSLVYPVRIRRRWSRIFLWLVFLAGIGANVIEYPLVLIGPDFNSWGASGIVYGALGVLFAACLQSLSAHLKTLSKERRRVRRRKKRGPFRFDRKFLKTFPALVTLSLLFSFFWLIFTDPGVFLSAGPGIDVFAHGFGFLGGFGGAMVLFRFDFRRVRASENR